jgi:hypothetical protein
MVAVAPSDPARPWFRRELLARRRERILRAFFGLRELVSDLAVCEDQELRRAVAETVLTHGLDGQANPAVILADTGSRRVAGIRFLQERPGVGRPLDGWRLVAGPDRRRTAPPADADRRRLAAWLELQLWWRYAFDGCLNPDAARTPYLCVKLVSEPVRAWLWLEHGEAVAGRREALLQGLRALPEEEPTLRRTLDLDATLNRFPDAPLADALGLLARLTTRVAAHLQAAVDRAGATEVRLVGSSQELLLPSGVVPQRIVPLADWRAIVAPRIPDEGLAARAGDPIDPRAIADAARASRPGVLWALQWGPLVVLPTTNPHAEAILRAVQCPVSDPVTHALLTGQRAATFPELRGWSARHVARRAVAEHAAWLQQPASSPRPYSRVDLPQPVSALARLLTAARAAVFAESMTREEPTLAVTVAATRSLAQDEQLVQAIDRARIALQAWHRERRPCPRSTVSELHRAVVNLGPYRSTTPEPIAGGSGHSRA